MAEANPIYRMQIIVTDVTAFSCFRSQKSLRNFHKDKYIEKTGMFLLQAVMFGGLIQWIMLFVFISFTQFW